MKKKGAGDSGKSTIIKQMRLIHASGFTKYERESFRLMIFTNIIGSMQALLEGMHHHKFTFENEANWVSSNCLMMFNYLWLLEIHCIIRKEACFSIHA